VIARVKAILKRVQPVENKAEQSNTKQITFKNIVIDLEAKELYVNEQRVVLTKSEFELLTLLAKNPDKILSRDDIIAIVWHETPFITERTVDVHITRLRKKMGEYGSVIMNRSGYGYKFNTDEIRL
jgi:DNA-binding response OmpR family regulator